MSVNTSSVALALLGLVVSAACGGSSTGNDANTGATGSGATGGTNGSASGGSSSGSSGTGGGRTNPTSTTGPKFTGSGTGYVPLTPGCGPATASECTGDCEATAAADPSTIIRPPATLCFGGAEDPTPENPLATIEQVLETIGGKRMIHLRVTFDPSFVDNTYGENACCGWPEVEGNTDMPMDPGMMPGMMGDMKPPKPGKGGHTFKDLVGSDHLELLLTNGTGDTVMDFKIDYISEDASSDCGYRTLGVTGGEGKMLLGDASAVLGVSTSFDRDLNSCGYCYTVDSPATDENYTPNPDTPAWDYRVVYEVWIDLDAFGSAGFGQAYINSVHASPSKLDTNTVEVSATPCPGDWDTPMGDTCPQNWTVYVQSEGKSSCVPIPFSNYPDMKPCPEGYQLDAATEGKYCIPL